MEEKIKSRKIFKLIFSFQEKIKMKILKYNKRIQNIMNLNLIAYKIFSQKYIIYETIKKGKEYNFHKDYLIYEGEYLNGEGNGKGKEYDNDGNLIFEGEFIKGKRFNGKEKEYDYRCKLIFESEYLDGKRNGIGKKYFKNS